jgi:hypothetical protein
MAHRLKPIGSSLHRSCMPLLRSSAEWSLPQVHRALGASPDEALHCHPTVACLSYHVLTSHTVDAEIKKVGLECCSDGGESTGGGHPL